MEEEKATPKEEKKVLSKEEQKEKEERDKIDEMRSEITEFIHDYFANIDQINDYNLSFLEMNNMSEPKRSYIKLIRFLNTAIENLKNLDPNMFTGTLVKIHRDYMNLYALYHEYVKIKNIKSVVFNRDFLENFKPYKTVLLEISRYESLKTTSEAKMKTVEGSLEQLGKNPQKDDKQYKQYKKQYNDALVIFADARDKLVVFRVRLKEIEKAATGIFFELFDGAISYYIQSIEKIINTKTHYAEQLLWERAKNSKAVRDFFARARISGEYSTKIFIKYYLRNINTSSVRGGSDWHAYLKECLDAWED